MTVDLSRTVTITITPEGYFLHLPDKMEGIALPDLAVYLTGLRIPNLRREAVKDALEKGIGMKTLIAPLRAAAAGPAPATAPPPRSIRWIKPYINPSAPIKPATNVLIVDTSKAMVDAFDVSFQGAGLDLSLASQPRDFINHLGRATVPDLILVAARIGNLDGGMLSMKIRSMPKTSKVPVIMYSSTRPRQEILMQFDRGITDYFVMPMPPDLFRQKIQQTLSQIKKTIPMSQVNGKTGKANKSAAGVPGDGEAGKARTLDISLRDLIQKVKDILAVPHILERVMKISSDSVSGAKELAQAVRSDPATVAMVLRKANSVYYGKGEPIKEVQEAIVRIGLTEIKTLVLGMSVISQFSKTQKTNGFDRCDFWKHSLATAILARIFARQVKLPDPEEAFVGGLLHDIGKIIFDEYANPPYDDIVMAAIRDRTRIIDEERSALSFTHVDVGRSLVQHWKFPEHLELIVSRHHSPESRGNEQIKEQELLLVRVIYIANLITKALQIGSGGDLAIHELPFSPWVRSFTQLKLGRERLNEFRGQLEEMAKFLEVEGGWGQSAPQSEGELPHVHLVDHLQDARVIDVTRIHLEEMGYEVTNHLRVTEIKNIEDGRKSAMCILADSYDKIKNFWDEAQQILGGKSIPVVFTLPEMEKNILERTGTIKRPDFFNDNNFLLFEPYDTSLLHNALEGIPDA